MRKIAKLPLTSAERGGYYRARSGTDPPPLDSRGLSWPTSGATLAVRPRWTLLPTDVPNPGRSSVVGFSLFPTQPRRP
jgi:hypothetical protein